MLAGFDIPPALPAQLPEQGEWLLDAAFAWGNSAITQINPRETLIVDAETRELRVVVGRSFANGYALQIQVPYRHTSAGSLDSFIDNWHDFFSLPEGVRPELPRDALRVVYERDGTRLLDERSTQSGIGDISFRLGKQLATPLTAWLGVKLPTGDAAALTGSGSVDVTAALAFERRFGGRYAFFAQGAGTWLGDGDRLARQQKSLVWSGLAGIDVHAFGNLTLTAQVDAHSAVYDSDESFLGDAVTLTLGGTLRIGKEWDLTFAVSEDVAVESAPDVVFLFALERAL